MWIDPTCQFPCRMAYALVQYDMFIGFFQGMSVLQVRQEPDLIYEACRALLTYANDGMYRDAVIYRFGLTDMGLQWHISFMHPSLPILKDGDKMDEIALSLTSSAAQALKEEMFRILNDWEKKQIAMTRGKNI